MSIFDAFRSPDINDGVEEFRNTKGAHLIDVREPEEYEQGHIPGSVNIPLQQFARISEVVKDKDAPLFVYCRSGARSGRAASGFFKLGYTNVRNIGGILSFKGEVERSSAW